jgi:hypothetical protein
MIFLSPDRHRFASAAKFPNPRSKTKGNLMKHSIAKLCAVFVASMPAGASKLCIVDPQSYAYNATGQTWAVGTGCGNTEKSGDPATWCAGLIAHGISRCRSDAVVAGGQPGYYDWSGIDYVEESSIVGNLCLCQTQYPNKGMVVPYNPVSNCVQRCGQLCGAMGSAYYSGNLKKAAIVGLLGSVIK